MPICTLFQSNKIRWRPLKFLETHLLWVRPIYIKQGDDHTHVCPFTFGVRENFRSGSRPKVSNTGQLVVDVLYLVLSMMKLCLLFDQHRKEFGRSRLLYLSEASFHSWKFDWRLAGPSVRLHLVVEVYRCSSSRTTDRCKKDLVAVIWKSLNMIQAQPRTGEVQQCECLYMVSNFDWIMLWFFARPSLPSLQKGSD